ncbi:M1 family peptidase [Paenibacillus contaminans]|uniref:M1 family peptidase n=2 Tax=Paenibacillus contaminans TaxID=450362 RepID=A0A329LXP7_9BACL|nr:M1 family peptidase [Paenibacillus contaminans]
MLVNGVNNRMKPIPASRSVLWIVAVLLVCGLTITLHALLFPKQTGQTIAVSSLNEPDGNNAIPLEPPKTPEKTTETPLSNRIVEYHMSAVLQPDSKTLLGAQTVTWENPGKKPVSELYFHLYPNAFESKKTTFNRESGGKLRDTEMKGDTNGSMSIQSIVNQQGMDLLPRISYVQPDDGNASDRTLMKLELPQTVGPGQKVTLTMKYAVKLPYVYARMGYADNDFYMIGQWFPKVAVYEPAGMRGREEEGWNLHQYHGNSEFYADFGIFDVKIKVPSSYVVAATGFPTKPAAEDKGYKTYSFYADDVHDFAWAASPNFKYFEEPFSTPDLPGVRIKLYLDPKHEPYKNRYMLAAKKALSRYSEWYGTYPYSTLSIVVPPEGGDGAGGMEYPNLVTAWSASDEKPSLELERVVVHEIGHQFFYGMVASNEFEEAWLDEGFTSYAEDKLMEKEYGVRSNLPLEGSYMTAPAPLKKNAWDYGSHGQYAENVYTRSKLVLSALEKEVGTATMNKIMRTYFSRWKFKHPSTQDFQKTVEDVTKRKWDDFFNQYVYGGMMIDYAVESIRMRKTEQQGQTVYESEVLIRKRGAQHDAVPIRFHFSDGTKLDKTWNSDGTETLYKLSHSAPVDWVMIDPDRNLILENKHMNNFMKAEVDPKWNARWNIGIDKILETLFGWVAW